MLYTSFSSESNGGKWTEHLQGKKKKSWKGCGNLYRMRGRGKRKQVESKPAVGIEAFKAKQVDRQAVNQKYSHIYTARSYA